MGWYGGGLLAVLFTLLPLYVMVKISVSPPAEVFTPHPSFAIHEVTSEHWQTLLTAGTVQQPLSKSLMVATWTMLGAIGLAAPAAYVMARLPPAWKYGLLLSLFASRMIPEVGIALPVAVRFLEWGLADTQLGLVLAHLIKTLPFVA
jgi:trehalose transport system permease protein